MALPILAYVATGGTLVGASGNLAAFAPLLVCVAAHVLMIKLMGKSCHGAEKKPEPEIVPKTFAGRPTKTAAIGAMVGPVMRS